MIKVFAWPCVGMLGSLITREMPVRRSRSMITGRDYLSTVQRRRRNVTAIVSGRSADGMAAGYLDMLMALTDGVHAVRVSSFPVNRATLVPSADGRRRSHPLRWSASGDPLAWEADGEPLSWFTGTVLRGTPGEEDGWSIIEVEGLPPDVLVARPAEYVRVFAASDEGVSTQVVAPAWSDASGVSRIRVLNAVPEGSDQRVNIGPSHTGVYRITNFDPDLRRRFDEQEITVDLREVFEDEVGGFEEVDPWS